MQNRDSRNVGSCTKIKRGATSWIRKCTNSQKKPNYRNLYKCLINKRKSRISHKLERRSNIRRKTRNNIPSIRTTIIKIRIWISIYIYTSGKKLIKKTGEHGVIETWDIPKCRHNPSHYRRSNVLENKERFEIIYHRFGRR